MHKFKSDTDCAECLCRVCARNADNDSVNRLCEFTFCHCDCSYKVGFVVETESDCLDFLPDEGEELQSQEHPGEGELSARGAGQPDLAEILEEEIKEMLRKSIEGIFEVVQAERCIVDGGVEPLVEMRIESLIGTLAEAMKDAIEQQTR